jgi:NAD(P)-dependent dehydrogenase (short-subunit alcohol dehydrogenase family)
MNFSLDGKIALVTGASRGIGRATALEFARSGADVIVVSRKLADLEEVAAEIMQLGRRSLAVSAHVGRMDEIKDLVSRVREEFARVDILVNNAGTSQWAPAIDVEERLWDAIMNLNLKGLFFLSQAIARIMKEHCGGKIINVTSMDATRPEFQGGVYAISKAAVAMATKVMAVEWAAYNIRVNAIAPGNVHTRLGDSRFAATPEYEQKMIRRTPLGRIANPEEIVGAMVYLASDASSFHTGDILSVDGGIPLTW